MNNQCKSCIHKSVCAYKEHYEDAVNLYKEAQAEAGKYPWFRVEITCCQYRTDEPTAKTLERKENGK